MKYNTVWLFLIVALFTGCETGKNTPLVYKKSAYKFRQTEDGHTIKEWKPSSIPYTIVESIKNGKWDGFRRFYDIKDGKITKEEMYKEGKLHGLQRSFDKKGKVTSRSTYKDGSAGYGVDIWYVRGKLYYIRNYKEGRLHGRSRDWHIDTDILWSDTMYKKGKKHGMEKRYRLDDRTLLYTIDYENGERHGYFKHYTKDGKLEYAVRYEKGMVQSIVKYLPNGNKLDISPDSVYITDVNGVVKRG